MIDIYMNGAEVHAETPEEEREASLILSAALSGKTIPAGGCICPDQRIPRSVKALQCVFAWYGYDYYAYLRCRRQPRTGDLLQHGGCHSGGGRGATYYYEVRLEPKPVLRSYIAAAMSSAMN